MLMPLLVIVLAALPGALLAASAPRVKDPGIGPGELLEERHLTADYSVRGLFYSRDGSQLLTGSIDHVARLWNVRNGNVAFDLDRGGQSPDYMRACFFSVALSPDGLLALTGSTSRVSRSSLKAQPPDCAAHLWDTRKGVEIRPLRSDGAVMCVAFSMDGQLAAAGGLDRTARIWEVKSGRLLWALKHSDPVTSLQFSPDGRRLYSASGVEVTAWDLGSGAPLRRWRTDDRYMLRVAVSGDGQYLAACGNGATVFLWRLKDGKETQLPATRRTGSYFGLAFSPDSHLLCAAGTWEPRDENTRQKLECTVWVLHVPDGAVKYASPIMSHRVQGLAFSPDGRHIATGADDGDGIRIWRLASPRAGQSDGSTPGQSDGSTPAN